MKKTLTVNLGGTVFHIDEDAYRLLDEYLCNLKLHFRKQQDAEEIVNDIEVRISELFLEKVHEGLQVITIAIVEGVIERIGKPEELIDGTEDSDFADTSESSKTTGKASGGTRRRLYRNPDDKMIGGVISGLAAYFNWDVTILRLIFLFILICGVGTLIPIYIVCWLILPEAHTAAEKLSMRGEAVTVENIGKAVTDGFEKAANGVNDYMRSDKPRTFFSRLANAFLSIVGFVLKAILVIMALMISPVLFILVVLFVVLIFTVISAMIGGGVILYNTLSNILPAVDWMYISSSPISVVVACIAGVVLLGIPLFGILFAILRQVFNWKPMVHGLKWTLFVLWVVSVAVCIFALTQVNWHM